MEAPNREGMAESLPRRLVRYQWTFQQLPSTPAIPTVVRAQQTTTERPFWQEQNLADPTREERTQLRWNEDEAIWSNDTHQKAPAQILMQLENSQASTEKGGEQFGSSSTNEWGPARRPHKKKPNEAVGMHSSPLTGNEFSRAQFKDQPSKIGGPIKNFFCRTALVVPKSKTWPPPWNYSSVPASFKISQISPFCQ